jgi:uncharacterized protein YhfF
VCEFAFPGPLRDELVAAVLSGAKTATSSTVLEYAVDHEPYPAVGDREVVIDSAGAPVAVIETTEVTFARCGGVDLAFALDEGEGFAGVAQWRRAHEGFWHSAAFRTAVADPGFTVTDDTELVLLRFRLVRVL